MIQGTLDLTFAALSDPTRRGVIELLRSEPRRASDLAASLGTSRPAMSRHLRVLRTSGLVEAKRSAPTRSEQGNDAAAEDDARERIYRLCPDPFAQLRTWLEQVEMFWTLQLASFKDHVERTNEKKKRS